ncbi:MAG: hypothetical protein R2715_09750 [Ilumatobacteraceae bacterium]
MSELWTPDGAHPEPERSSDDATSTPTEAREGAEPEAHEWSPEEQEALAALEETKRRLAEVPAHVVVVNHAMGLYELAAIHLSAEPPRLTESVLAIDAFACLVEGLGERLGPEVATLRDALNQIRLAFVQIKGTVSG